MSHLQSLNTQWRASQVYAFGWLSGDAYKQPEWKVTAGVLWVWSTGRAPVVHGGLWGYQIAGCRLSVCMESGILGAVCSLICLWGVLFSFQFPRCLSVPCTWLVRGLPSLNGPRVGGLAQLGPWFWTSTLTEQLEAKSWEKAKEALSHLESPPEAPREWTWVCVVQTSPSALGRRVFATCLG